MPLSSGLAEEGARGTRAGEGLGAKAGTVGYVSVGAKGSTKPCPDTETMAVRDFAMWYLP